MSVRVIGNWLGLEFASKMPNTGTRTGEANFFKIILCVAGTYTFCYIHDSNHAEYLR